MVNNHLLIKKATITFSIVFASLLFSESNSFARDIQWHQYQESIILDGSKLSLVGVGTRNKFFLDMYTMGVYTVDGKCNRKNIINKNQKKTFLLTMLRDIPSKIITEAFTSEFIKKFKNVRRKKFKDRKILRIMKKQFIQFQKIFKVNVKKNDTIRFDYIPNKGIFFYNNDKFLGQLKTFDFARVLFSIYFDKKENCCPRLHREIMSCEKE